MKKKHPPALDPPRDWSYWARHRNLPGPSAARERTILDLQARTKDPAEWRLLDAALRELYASAWREDVPEEDREWAQAYRRTINDHRRSMVGQSARDAYLQSSHGTFDKDLSPPWMQDSIAIRGAWCAFAKRIETAPEGESELATAEAASRAYWRYLWAPVPPWDGDPAQVHWLAAVRAARKALAAWNAHGSPEN